jgi:hypothetical protein
VGGWRSQRLPQSQRERLDLRNRERSETPGWGGGGGWSLQRHLPTRRGERRPPLPRREPARRDASPHPWRLVTCAGSRQTLARVTLRFSCLLLVWLPFCWVDSMAHGRRSLSEMSLVGTRRERDRFPALKRTAFVGTNRPRGSLSGLLLFPWSPRRTIRARSLRRPRFYGV